MREFENRKEQMQLESLKQQMEDLKSNQIVESSEIEMI